MSSGVCWGSRQPWGAAATARGRRCCPVTPLPGNGGFFPQNRKFILGTVRVYALFLNREFPKLGIGSASKWRYVYSRKPKQKFFVTLSCLCVKVYDTKAYFCYFFGPFQGVQGPKGQKGEPYVLPPDIASRYRVRL